MPEFIYPGMNTAFIISYNFFRKINFPLFISQQPRSWLQ